MQEKFEFLFGIFDRIGVKNAACSAAKRYPAGNRNASIHQNSIWSSEKGHVLKAKALPGKKEIKEKTYQNKRCNAVLF